MRRILLAFAMIVAPIFTAAQAATPPAVTMFAAASLTDATERCRNSGRQTGHPPSAPRSPPLPRWPGRSSRGRRPTCSPPPTSSGWTISTRSKLIVAGTRENLLRNDWS